MIPTKDTFLWYVLSVMGINCAGFRSRLWEKCFSTTIVFLFIFVTLHRISASFVHMKRNTILGGFNELLSAVLSAFIFFLMIKNKKKISKILTQIYKYRTRFDANVGSNFIIIVTFALLLLPGIMTLLLQHIFDFVKEEEEFWAYGYELNNKTFQYFIILYGNMVYYSTCSVISLITFSLSLTFYRFVEILQLYGKLIQRNFKELRCRKNVKILTEFFSIMKLLCLLNQVLSCISFLIVIYALEMLFTTMHLAVSLREQLLRRIPFLVKVIFNLVTGMLMIIIYTHCASMIPERIIEIKYIARDHIHNRISNPLITQDALFYLKRIVKANVVHISACGLFNFTRSFVLTAIGVTLTYDLLIINFN